MSQELWSAVDRFLADQLLRPDPSLEAALEASAVAGLPAIQVSPMQGKLLMLLAQVSGARRILEIGTLGGYSTIWLARALPAGGRLISLEANPKHAEVARSNIARAGLTDAVEIRVGRAQDSLPQIAEEGIGPFDLIFIDADKPSYVEYLQWAIKLSREGTVIIADNVVRGGAIVDPSNSDPTVEAARRFLEQLAVEPRLNGTAIQTIGSKGYDGFVIATVSSME